MEKELVRQMGIDCIELINKKLSGKLNREEYYIALMEMHKKYPMPGHNPPLTKFQYKHYYTIKTVYKDPDTGVLYLDHLYPWNFEESAEMFIRHQQKLDEQCLPLEAWKKKEWPLTAHRKIEPVLEGDKAEEFEKKREMAKSRLPYKDEEDW